MRDRSAKKQSRKAKGERVALLLAPAARRLVARAMAASGRSAEELLADGARRALEEHERMILAAADRDVFLRAVAENRAPTGKLVAALKRPREIKT